MTTENNAPEPAPLAPGTPEYDAAMASHYDARQAQAAAAGSENLTGTQPEPTPAVTPEPTPTPNEGEQPQPDANGDQSAFDLSTFSTEFATNGELSDESYTKLAEAGYPRDYVDQFIEGQLAVRELRTQKVLEGVGGAQEYAKMQQWAANALTSEEIEAFDAIVNGTDLNAINFAVQGLRSRFIAANGYEARITTPRTTSTVTAPGYQSKAEMTRDMRDPRYASDAAFRAEVARKLATSPIF